MSVYHRCFRYFQNMPKRIRRLSNKATLYGAALWVAIGSVVARTVDHFSHSTWAEPLSETMLATTAVLLMWAFLYDLNEWIKRLNHLIERSLIGKALLGGAITAAGAFSLARASSIINSVTGIAENPLTYTTTLLGVPSTVILVIVWLMAIYFFLALHICSNALLIVFFDIRNSIPFIPKGNIRLRNRRYRLIFLNALRLSGCFVLIFILTEISPLYIKGLTVLSRNFAFTFELKSVDPCARPGEKIIRVNDEVVLTARNPDAFEARRCAIGAGMPQ